MQASAASRTTRTPYLLLFAGHGNLVKARIFAAGQKPLPKLGCAAVTQQEEQAPISRLSPSEAHSQDLACYAFQQCAAAHEANDLAVFSRTFGASFAAVTAMQQDFPAYDDGVMKMPPRTWRGDAEYCLLSGFLDIPDPYALLRDPGALQQKVRETCSAIPEELKSTVSLAHGLWKRMNGGAALQSLRPAGLQEPFINRTEAQIHNAAYCASNSMDCMLHFCMDFYCKLPDGRIGTGCQCRRDYAYGMPPSK